MNTLGEQVETLMQSAGIKARTFATLVGCHYTTIYDLLKRRDVIVPLPIVQESIYDVLEFLADAVNTDKLPITANITVEQKTSAIVQLYTSYKTQKASNLR